MEEEKKSEIQDDEMKEQPVEAEQPVEETAAPEEKVASETPSDEKTSWKANLKSKSPNTRN